MIIWEELLAERKEHVMSEWHGVIDPSVELILTLFQELLMSVSHMVHPLDHCLRGMLGLKNGDQLTQHMWTRV